MVLAVNRHRRLPYLLCKTLRRSPKSLQRLLAGEEKYLVSALKAYKSGGRNNPIMKPMVAALSDADIENVAAYYASQPCK